MESLFVYGSLKDPETQKKIFGRAAQGIPDILPGYTRSSIEIQGNMYPIAIPKEGASIAGMVIEIGLDELNLVDAFETTTYQRINVTLKSGKTAWAYVISDDTLAAFARFF